MERKPYHKIILKIDIAKHNGQHDNAFYKSGVTLFPNELYNNLRISDITLIGKPDQGAEPNQNDQNSLEKIYAHRLVLSADSKYFKNMFSSGLSESHDEVIQFPMKFEALEIIIYFIYTGHIKDDLIGTSNFKTWEEVFYNAQLMNIPPLPRIAFWFSQRLLGLEDAIKFLAMCKESKGCVSIPEDVLDYLKKDWSDAVKF